MYKYKIDGGHPLKGTVRISGNKNAALPCIAAAMMATEAVILHNIPEIEDVNVMLDVCRSLGATVEKLANNTWRIDAGQASGTELPSALAAKVRASILFAGPILARFGRVQLPPPGGDVIGRRRLDTHLLALEELGARIEIDGTFQFVANKLKGADIFLDEASVTATENAVMAAALAEGTSFIRNAASEPHVQDLCRLLIAMGARISGIGSNILQIDGVASLHGADFTIGPDFMEVGSFIGLAAVSRGDLTIAGVNHDDLRMIKIGFAKLGITWSKEGDSLHVHPGQGLRVQTDLGGMIPKIDDAPWPGFPPDLTSIMTVVATQVEGTVLVFEKMFESRMFFVDKLIGMGARIVLCDPHRAVVSGPTRLRGSELVSPDVRAGMAMVIAALCAEGCSTIKNVYQIERGYERLTERLQALGAKIERLPE
ncbi:MAG: UDP-N-acetylglucosamine 1-carboxyvinyltransferase [Spirochaetes bacterium GWD1_61_31]|nr:MAG: UDP-N-acetylglucosamine 1-carboxyvinyltransferase [Spirochaetes bacterium GWB1_60_80]OHD30059.1 MAG: UDP-N-acetylglucosamine 1-carboxyvinyltransferase [Spirochaetes bacterium GWC1_61_12]OHD42548.1 MAG: UDP-N-acetylglucosamine 1-carboxyvinyltransferase [Spirochaetes bacterium GWD1_61_31]OHD45066.1 MAG: UDP-N-acetylglucosamine 1-carboxyvinyltransferase [Spirochaetes bacterium GWE1_60_18]OHD59994.1 MAG: UDP-N-acetylglucosamine 1-carboxyvinyltransferase [Spirochaetes bacterium GWF1_60_12]H